MSQQHENASIKQKHLKGSWGKQSSQAYNSSAKCSLVAAPPKTHLCLTAEHTSKTQCAARALLGDLELGDMRKSSRFLPLPSF